MKLRVIGASIIIVVAGLFAIPAPAAQATEIPSTAQVVFVGDSITNGGGSWTPSRDSFPNRWKNIACGQVQSCRDRVRVIGATGGCLAVSCGNQPALKDEWLTKVINITPKPTTIIVEIGVNDLFMNITDQQYGDGYKYLMDQAIAAGIRLIIATIPPTTTSWAWHTAHNPQRMGINNWLRSYYGADNLLDIDAGLRIGFTGDADPNYYYLQGVGDGLHPSSWGHACIADWLDPSRIV